MHRLSLLFFVFGLAANAQSTNRTFQVNGVVVGLMPAEKGIEIRHDAIPDYMGAMTMEFDVKDTNELAGLQTNDPISFRLIVTDTNGWVEGLQKRTNAAVTGSSEDNAFRRVRDVQPLNEGDLLPEYRFIDQSGKSFSTTDFKGGALAITFLFTRCPYPTYCPLMADHFAAAQQKLLASTNAPSRWHLLTISFDPDFDTPDVLKRYAEAHSYDSNHWTFATGTLPDITAIGDQFGLTFWRDQPGGLPSHNLRTAVIDAKGRVQKIFIGNQWKPEDLIDEINKATGR